MLINFEGWSYHVEVTKYTPERPAPMCQDHDSPNWSDPGDPMELEYNVKSIVAEPEACFEDIVSDWTLEELIETRLKQEKRDEERDDY